MTLLKRMYLTKKQVVKLTGLSATTVERWSRRGLFPAQVNLGNQVVRWVTEDVRAWLASRKSPGEPGTSVPGSACLDAMTVAELDELKAKIDLARAARVADSAAEPHPED